MQSPCTLLQLVRKARVVYNSSNLAGKLLQ
jgi:hypothetical protein